VRLLEDSHPISFPNFDSHRGRNKSGWLQLLAVVDGSCAIDARWFGCKRILDHVSRVPKQVVFSLTIGIDKGEDVEVVVVQERLCNVVTRLVSMDKLLSNVLNCACPY
jgi:hypothetical protein